jgi:hypothetical protein
MCNRTFLFSLALTEGGAIPGFDSTFEILLQRHGKLTIALYSSGLTKHRNRRVGELSLMFKEGGARNYGWHFYTLNVRDKTFAAFKNRSDYDVSRNNDYLSLPVWQRIPAVCDKVIALNTSALLVSTVPWLPPSDSACKGTKSSHITSKYIPTRSWLTEFHGVHEELKDTVFSKIFPMVQKPKNSLP